MSIQIATSCRHTHHVKLGLSDAETWIVPPRWKDAKPVLITEVTAQADPDGRITSVKLSGWYAKKDGTASKARLGYPERAEMEDLPLVIQLAVTEALGQVRHD